jgi:hypothetical protein
MCNDLGQENKHTKTCEEVYARLVPFELDEAAFGMRLGRVSPSKSKWLWTLEALI